MRMKVLAGLSLASLLYAQSLAKMRMVPGEMRGGAVDGNQIGSSGLAGVHTKVLFGVSVARTLSRPEIRGLRGFGSSPAERRYTMLKR